MKPVMTHVEILRDAHRLIADRGWCQGVFGDHGRWCPIGAMRFVTSHWDRNSEYDSAREAFATVIGCESIIHWNDSLERSKEEVLDAFGHAIALLESQKAEGL